MRNATAPSVHVSGDRGFPRSPWLRGRRFIACLVSWAGLICWAGLGATPAVAQHSSAAEARTAKIGGSFDRDQALGLSQGALGRRISDFQLTDTNGNSRQLSDYLGKPLVVSLIFTSCAHICPATTQHLKRGVATARQALGDDSFNVVTIGFDTDRDTPEMLARFASQQGVDLAGWDFLATDSDTIKRLSADLGFLYFPAGGGFDHLIQSTILDAEGVVYRQIYGIDFKIPHLVEPLKELVFGLKPDQSIYEDLTSRIRLFCTVYDPASGSYRFSYAIFVGLVIGLIMGAAAIYLLIREWGSYRNSRKKKAATA